MQTQYERTVQRYEDRIKIDKDEMQRELKDRSQRLLEEKEAAEAKYQAKFQAMLAEATEETASLVAAAGRNPPAGSVPEPAPAPAPAPAPVAPVPVASPAAAAAAAAIGAANGPAARVDAMWAEAEAEVFSPSSKSRDEILMADVERRARESTVSSRASCKVIILVHNLDKHPLGILQEWCH